MKASSATADRTCPQHGPFGEIRDATGRILLRWRTCPKCGDERRQAERERDARVYHERRVAELTMRAQLPPRFHGLTFEDYRAEHEGQRTALQVAREYAERFTGRESVVFVGKAGTGKTMLASIIAQALTAEELPVAYRTANGLLREFWDATSKADVLAAVARPALLVLDDVGVIVPNERERAQLFDVIDARYQTGRGTLLISNRSFKALEAEVLGERIADRIREHLFALVPFTWPSARQPR